MEELRPAPIELNKKGFLLFVLPDQE